MGHGQTVILGYMVTSWSNASHLGYWLTPPLWWWTWQHNTDIWHGSVATCHRPDHALKYALATWGFEPQHHPKTVPTLTSSTSLPASPNTWITHNTPSNPVNQLNFSMPNHALCILGGTAMAWYLTTCSYWHITITAPQHHPPDHCQWCSSPCQQPRHLCMDTLGKHWTLDQQRLCTQPSWWHVFGIGRSLWDLNHTQLPLPVLHTLPFDSSTKTNCSHLLWQSRHNWLHQSEIKHTLPTRCHQQQLLNLC